jgi:hypothetical protein
MICGYRHFLAVAEKDDERDAAVYDLGTSGTIEKIEWQPAQGGRILLRLTALNYPAHVFDFLAGPGARAGYVPAERRDRLTHRQAGSPAALTGCGVGIDDE